ncbi:outer membrane protein transport protein [Acinetobacter variabilis]|uniref:outer membrane protein transport protein n=1 Tax=Acinetobacter variabilis TaxID=70346 RepID=UPI001BB5EB72|nr:outer membrane protein transport protein [Acinetobacter variabilis]BCT89856.1 long-chain fatty acid transporter [Acinetobacter variabilis]
MKLKTLTTAMILATVPMTGAFAAALDRSGQSMAAFLQPGNYFEAGISVLDPDVSGKEAGTSETRRNIEDMAGDYYFPSAALKFQPTEKFSVGILYDQPYGADAEYQGTNVFTSNPGTDTILSTGAINNIVRTRAIAALEAQGQPVNDQTIAFASQQVRDSAAFQQLTGALAAGNNFLGEGNTKVEVDTQNLSLVFGYQPTENWNIYGGGVYQTVKGNLSLRGQAYSLFNGYDATFKETSGTGWLAGLAFQIPDIALKASVTYRSEIDHDVSASEDLSLLNFPLLTTVLGGLGVSPAQLATLDDSGKTKITTPQSVNLDFQTGVMANTVAFANVRWVDWSNFSIRPYQFGNVSEAVGPLIDRPDGFNLVEYEDDQISATVGVGRKFNDLWAGNVSVGWDSGAGNPVSTLGPTEGYWNVGLGLQYSPTPATFIAGGVKYFMLGDAKAQTGAQAGSPEYVAKFEDNDAWAYGLKIGYRF